MHNKYGSKDVHTHNPLGTGAENKTAHLFTKFILPVFPWFIIYESINLYDTAAAKRVWLAAALPIIPFARIYGYGSVCLSGLTASSLSIRVHLLCNLSRLFSLTFFFFFLLHIFFYRTSLSGWILLFFMLSLKHFKLRWWLANLSEINLMGSACAHSPHGCTFMVVLLIFSWKATLQCPPRSRFEKGRECCPAHLFCASLSTANYTSSYPVSPS